MRLQTRHVTALAALVALLVLSTGIAYYITPWLSESYTLNITVEIPRIHSGGKLYGWVEVIASAPGAKPLTKTVWVKPGARTVTVMLDATKLVKESKKAIRSASPERARLLRDEASTVTVVLMLYDGEGRHYLASTIIGSYDIALKKYRDLGKAFRAVEQNPYLVLQAGALLVKAEAFSMVNVTSLYESIIEEYYRLPNPAKHLEKPVAGAHVAPSGLGLPAGCTVVTIDNYKNYDLLLTDEDFIVLPELYNAKTPESFKQHLQGLSSSEKERVYKEFKTKFSTAVYIPASCPLYRAINYAMALWYDPNLWKGPALAGLRTLQGFWLREAENAGISLNPFRRIRWVDVSTQNIQRIDNAPLLRLAGVCQSGCKDNVDFQIIVSAGESSYYKNGISIANIIFLGEEASIQYMNHTAVPLSPSEIKAGDVGFITADTTIYSCCDGVFVDYYVGKVTLYDKWGRPHKYWVMTPVIVFTPLQIVHINWSTLHNIVVNYKDSSYGVYMSKYFKLLGATRANYTWKSKYIPAVNPGRREGIILDATNYVKQRTSYAGAVIGLAQNLLGLVLSAVLPPGGAIAKFAGIAGSLISYAYDNYGESMVIISLQAMPRRGFDGGYVEVLKVTPYLGYNPKELYFSSEKYSEYPLYPIFITYFIIYRG